MKCRKPKPANALRQEAASNLGSKTDCNPGDKRLRLHYPPQFVAVLRPGSRRVREAPMAQINAGDFRKGIKIIVESQPFEMTACEFVKPARGRLSTRPACGIC